MTAQIAARVAPEVSAILHDDAGLREQERPELTIGGCGETASITDDETSIVWVAQWPQRDCPAVSDSCGGPIVRWRVHGFATRTNTLWDTSHGFPTSGPNASQCGVVRDGFSVTAARRPVNRFLR